MKKIIIFNRYKYFGGTLVLSCLCKTLRELGYDARLFMCVDIPFNEKDENHFLQLNVRKLILRRIKRILYDVVSFLPGISLPQSFKEDITSVEMDGLKFQSSPFFDKDNTIVIYPEVTFGNPLGAKNVVRWMMYYYPYEEDSNAYSPDDVFIAYREIFNSPKLNPDNIIITQRYFDNKLYRRYNFGERKDKCYVLRKGRNRGDLPKHFDGPVYDDNMSQKELVKMFNEYKYCYSYDTQTFYASIACVCGCIPIIVMEPGKTKSDYVGPGDKCMGKAYGDSPEELEYAVRTREELLHSLDYDELNRKNAIRLINLLEQRFGEIKRIS